MPLFRTEHLHAALPEQRVRKGVLNSSTCDPNRNVHSVSEYDRGRWIARELHDDVCQRLTILTFKIGQARGELRESPIHCGARLSEIEQYCAKLASDVQMLSQGLHSSTLEYLGIEAGLDSLCREFGAQHDVEVCFVCEDIPRLSNKELELSIYRIAQEALHNAGKHSRSSDFSVTLRGLGDELHLEVRDWGVGFCPKATAGLGLISMKERTLLLSGSFSIESKANWGTRIRARVPLSRRIQD